MALAQPPMGPPREAFDACAGKQDGGACRFTAPHGEVQGSCRTMREGRPVCVPSRPPPGAGLPQRSGQRGGPEGSSESPAMGGGMGRGGPVRIDIAGHDPTARHVGSRIPDTHQGSCFDDQKQIPCPSRGEPFFGQDAQYEGATPSYQDNGDGTITDRVTGLMWQQAHNARRLGWYAARNVCGNLSLGGHHDWRLPDIKELYSLADFRGAAGRRPYINDVFEIREPGPEVLEGDRFAATHHLDMMGQTWSSTIYTGLHWNRPGVEAAFFFNFFDGRIKQAPTHGGRGLFYRCVRGPKWGANDFVDNGDDTVTDRASGLQWQQADDGRTRDWKAALAYCETLNLAGHDDWRLPNVKALQSIVDYHRNDPALDTTVFRQTDRRGWFWSSTTLGDDIRQAAYVCFGKCVSVDGIDTHGAGAQRSDPKSGNPADWGPMGGQRDAVRIDNYVRCVRSTGQTP